MLVTGGCGFIGSNFIKYLLEVDKDARIINLDALTYAGNLANLKDVDSSRCSFVIGDVADMKIVKQIVGLWGIRTIINFAAESHVDRSIQNSEPFIRTNINGTHALLEATRESHVELFLQVSTDEVYGSAKEGQFFSETDQIKPSNPYSASKAGADVLVQSYVNTYRVPAIITRCSNNYGPNQFPEKLIPLVISRLMAGKPATVYGDGRHIRDWINVRDHCRALHTVLMNGQVGEIYNICADEEYNTLQVIETIAEAIGKVANKSLFHFVKDRPGHDKRYAMSRTKIKNLGWDTEVRFNEGMRQTVAWYKENPAWLLRETATPGGY